ncbi:hypothetical protein DENSPDRAFT_830844 [Dentipellis sp. KUC8613]|nr:hypothetical protein DENSPDRAFT_830844 [Dentipellis sp. KUC8613]
MLHPHWGWHDRPSHHAPPAANCVLARRVRSGIFRARRFMLSSAYHTSRSNGTPRTFDDSSQPNLKLRPLTGLGLGLVLWPRPLPPPSTNILLSSHCFSLIITY